MTSLYQDIKSKLASLNVLEQTIVINTIVFILSSFLSLLSSKSSYQILNIFSLSNDIWEVVLYPWTILTYGFFHYSFSHLFFNMLVLFFLAKTFSNLFLPRLALKVYLLGIISGALFFSITSYLIPGIIKINAPLVGASAGVRACIIFLCVYMPTKLVSFFRFSFKLKYLGILMVILDLPGLFSINSGGTIAHIGGYVLGYFYANQLQNGKEVGLVLDKILDYFNSKSFFKMSQRKKKNMNSKILKQRRGDFTNQRQVDLILDKISKSGYESLTQKEKDFLFRAGKNK